MGVRAYNENGGDVKVHKAILDLTELKSQMYNDVMPSKLNSNQHPTNMTNTINQSSAQNNVIDYRPKTAATQFNQTGFSFANHASAS